ncbi:MAG: TPM domain-containing protein [Bacteroidales bacterium]|nr:TPM domain-containing protein [Bacteroidales bacterium]
MNLKKLLSLFVLLVVVSLMSAQIPPAPVPPRLVNDFAGVLQPRQLTELEHRLVAFNDTTSNMICVVIVDDMGGYSEQEFAYEIGDKWGVRSRTAGKRNGVVMLVKVKRNNSDFGAAYIAPGYDLEAVLPDAFCKNVADNVMIPRFREGDYYQGIVDALDIILPIVAGEISFNEYEHRNDGEVLLGFGLFLIFIVVPIILLIILDRKNRKNGGNGTGRRVDGKDVMKWILIGSLIGRGQGNSSGGYSGGGYSGGSSGGFGGFGGSGGFGGGGGGGRW